MNDTPTRFPSGERAGFWRRAGAAAIDLALMTLLYLTFLMVGAWAVRLGLRSAGAPFLSMEFGAALFGPALGLGVIIAECYVAGFTRGGGQTPGKMAVGIRVSDRDGDDPSWIQSLLRVPAYGCSWAVVGLGFLMAALPGQRALHDVLTGTVVVRTTPEEVLPLRRGTYAMVGLCLVGAALGAPHHPAAAAELVERIYAVANDRFVTASDVAAYHAFFASPETSERAAIDTLIDRQLLLEEADRFAVPAAQRDLVMRRVEDLIERHGGAEKASRALARLGWTRKDLEVWVGEDLRVEDFLQQRIYFFVLITPDDIARYTEMHQQDMAGLSSEEVRLAVTAKLTQERGEEKRREFMAKLRTKATIRLNIDPRSEPVR